jgi:hypothetical protein
MSGRVERAPVVVVLDERLDLAFEALDGGDGSDHVYGLDLRLPSTARGSGEGGSSADAACHSYRVFYLSLPARR